MRGRALIINTNYMADLSLGIKQRIYNLAKTDLKSLPSVVKHFPGLAAGDNTIAFRSCPATDVTLPATSYD